MLVKRILPRPDAPIGRDVVASTQRSVRRAAATLRRLRGAADGADAHLNVMRAGAENAPAFFSPIGSTSRGVYELIDEGLSNRYGGARRRIRTFDDDAHAVAVAETHFVHPGLRVRLAACTLLPREMS